MEIRPQGAAIRRQGEKRRQPVKQALLRQRKAVIAPVFATRKPARGFRRWTVRGRENLRTPGARRCTAFNLPKRYQHGAAARLGAAPQLAAV